MTKHLLNKQQRDAGLGTFEDDHNLYLTDMPLYVHPGFPRLNHPSVVAMFNSSTVTIKELQREADEYLIKRGK